MLNTISNRKVLAGITAGLILLFAISAQAQITVSLPDTTAERGSSIWIPVNTTYVDPVNYILTYELSVTTDDLVAAAYDTFDHTGTITPAGWSLHNYVISPDSIYGNSGDLSFLYPLSGEGPVVYFRFDIPETAVGSTDLTLAAFNYGAIYPELVNGSITISNPNAAIDGYCYLQGYSDHSGTAVEFEAVSASAVSQTVYTNAAGYYAADLVVGTYNVTYTHEGFGDQELLDQQYLDEATLAEVTLQPVMSGEYLSGALAGILPEGGSWIVNGNIWVANGAELTIEPGVTLLFDGAFTFTIEGLLTASGTENNGITFQGNATDVYWSGIKFLNSADDNSILEYCTITGSSNTGLKMTSANPTISHCTISGNTAAASGAGIVCADGASPSIDHCLIKSNSALNGSGGGVLCYNISAPVITNCVIFANSSTTFGSGVQIQSNSAPAISHTIVKNNTRQGINFNASPNATVRYCDVQGNTTGNFTGSVPAGMAQFTLVNGNGDPCDIFYNMNLAPQFYATTGDSAFFLTAISPCIDAGDPGAAYDPDGTVKDIGLYYFHQDAPNAPADLTATPNDEVIELAWTWTDYDIDLFNIYRGTAANPTEIYDTADYPGLTYTDDNITSGVTYYYRVTALGYNGLESGYSNEAEAVSVFNLTYHVPGDYTTIQAAIDASSSGDSVIVADGTFTGVGNRDIDFGGRNIVVISENGPDNCIIDCEGSGRGFICTGGQSAASFISGFKIINGSATLGGGLYFHNSSPTVTNCILTNCEADWGGAGYFSYSFSIFENCEFSSNTANRGGAVCFDHSGATIDYSIMVDNHAVTNGAAMNIFSQNATVTISNCTITGNVADAGNYIIYLQSQVEVDFINNIIASNTGSSAIHADGGCTASIGYNDFFGNTGQNFSGDIPAGLGTITTVNANGDPSDEFFNIFLDPIFTGTGGNPYELEWNSPCVDAGDPASPLDPDGTVADMGAYPLNQDEVPPIVSLPEVTVTAGESVTIPLTTSMLEAGDAYNSYTMSILYDAEVAEATGYSLAGTVTPSGWFPNFDLNTPGEIGGGSWGVTPAISGEGTLVNFDFEVPITAYGETDLHFDFLNFDDDAAITLDGKIMVTVPQFTIDGMCYLANQTDHSGTTVDFTAVSGGAVTTSDVTDETGAYSVTLNAGVYDVAYTHTDYQTESLNDEEFYADETLAELTLYREVVGTELSGEIGGLVLSAQTYTVISDIWISQGLTTSIQPGANILFTNNTQFDVNGRLNAIGTESDSIKFQPFSAGEHWGGIDFNDSANDLSQLKYCLVTGSDDSGIEIISSNPFINHTSIFENNRGWISAVRGGGVLLDNSASTIEYCDIFNNYAFVGGGVAIQGNSIAHLINCKIYNDSSAWGGGISIPGGTTASPVIINCEIFGNIANEGAGGMGTGSSGLTEIIGCLITGNSAGQYGGGGVHCAHSNAIISGCTITDNDCQLGSGIGIEDADVDIINSIISDNTGGGGIDFISPTSGEIIYNNVSNNSGGNFTGTVPAGVGTITTTNFNGDDCDEYYNIFLDPAFVGGGDYNLTAGSPCIDAGDPAGDNDPDGTIADIGAYYYHQDVPPAPTNLTATGDNVNHLIDLAWEWVDYDIDYFRIYRGTTAANTALYDSTEYPVMEYADGGIASSQVYYYKVTAVGHNGLQSAYSNTANATATWTETRYVPGQYATIQEAIDACNNGDSVLVADGIYSGTGNYDMDFQVKSIVVISENGPEECIIDCQQLGRAFYIHGNQSNAAVISGFTFTNAAYTWHGGAIDCQFSSPTISNCIFDNNSTTQFGGALALEYSNSVVEGCVFTNNSSAAGGAIFITTGNPAIDNCTFSGNSSTGPGSAVNFSNSEAVVTNCIVEGHSGTAAMNFYSSNLSTVQYSDFYNNTAGNFFEVPPAGLGTITTVNANGDPSDQYYNIFLNPQFTGTGDNPYELLWNSPAIDAGDPASPLDPDGSTADMGAFPFDQNAAPPVVWFPDTTVTAGNSITIPLMTTNIDSAYNAYLSYTMNVTYNAAKATATGYSVAGAVTPSNWSHLHNLNNPGAITGGSLSFSGPYLQGEGALVFYTFNVPITSYGETALHFNSFYFDDYIPVRTDGRITIQVPQFTIDGNCQLGEQTNHAGIKVKFAAVSGGAVSDSVYTDAAGDFSLELNAGQYNVTYSYAGYGSVQLPGEEFYADETLADVILYPPPTDFGLLTPAYGDTAWVLSQVITWEESVDPDPLETAHYDVWLSNSPSMANKWQAADSILATNVNLTNLLDNTAYYWTVRATDGNTPGTWADDTLMFRTYLPQAPAAFALLQPGDGTVQNNDTVTVSWAASSDPDPGDLMQYQIDWGIDPAFGSYESAVLTATSYTITDVMSLFDEIPDDATVYWRVKAFDTFGLTTWGSNDPSGWSFTIDVFNAPSGFTLTTPAYGDTAWTYQALLEWSQSYDPDPYDTAYYDLWVAASPTLANKWLAADSIEAHQFNLTNLNDNTAYYWTVRATDSNTPGTWAEDTLMFRTYVPEAPGAFALSSPGNGGTVHNDTVTVTWTASADPDPGDAVEYTVEWSLDPAFGTFESAMTALTNYTITDIAAMLDEIPDDAVVYWRVRAEDNYSLTTWANGSSEGWSFIVDVFNAPEAFSLAAPQMGDTVWTSETVVSWNESIDPDPYDTPNYDLWVGTLPNLNDSWLAAEGIAELEFLLTDLMDDTTYYWTVRATDSNTPGTWAEDTLMFRTFMTNAPGEFQLAFPENGNTVHDDTVEVSWTASADPDPGDVVTYYVEWSLNQNYSVFESEITQSTTYSIENIARNFDEIPDDATVFWRVRAEDSYGLSTWANGDTTGWSFNIDVFNAPEAFSLISPANGDTSFALEAELEWAPSYDPDPYDEVHYDVWVGTYANLNDAWLAGENLPEAMFTLTDLLDDTTYYWTVRATDSNTPGTWAEDTLMFRTYLASTPGPFALAYPENGGVIHEDVIEIGWFTSIDPDPGDPVSYVVQWTLDPEFTLFDSDTTSDTSYVLEDITRRFDNLPDDTEINWRVLAIDNYGMSTWANDDPAGWYFTIDVYNAPEPFGLLTPAQEDTVWMSYTDLTWEESTDPDPYDTPTYDVWIGLTPDLSDAWLAAEAVEETVFNLTDLNDDSDYYWTVRATDSNTPGTWAEDTLMFHTYLPEAPGEFCLSYPENSSSVHEDVVEVGWFTSIDPDPGDAVSYTVQWSLDAAFTTFDSGTTTDTFFIIEDLTQLFDGLPDDETVYWRVQASDGFELTTWANDDPAGWSFNVDIYNAPSVFSLLTPEYGDTSWVLSAELTWAESFDPDPYDVVGYDVWLGITPDLSDAWLAAEAIEETGFELIDLDDDTEYYWTVRATDSNTPGTWSDDTLMFRTYLPEAPGAFALAYPENGITVHEDEVETGWYSTTDPDPGDEFEYVIEWSLDAGFATFDSGTTTDTFFVITEISAMFEAVSGPGAGEINGFDNNQRTNRAGGNPSPAQPLSEGTFTLDNLNLTPPENQLDALPDDAVIYWRVKAVDSFELYTWANEDPSGWWFMTDLPEAPSNFGLLEPADEDTVWALEAGLSWEEAVDPDPGDVPHYDVWVGLEPDLSDAWLAAENVPELEFLLSDLADDSEYYWTVRATDSNTPGTWADDTLMFRTYYPEMPAPFGLLTPENGAILTLGETEFSWEEAADPDPGDIVTYTLWFIGTADSIGYDMGSAVSVMVNPDTVSVLIPGIPAVWYVTAASAYPATLIESVERFDFTPPNLAEITDVVVSVDGADIILAWTAPLGTQGNYKIYRNDTPYFDLTSAQAVFEYAGPITGEVTWTDVEALIEYDKLFYIVTHELLPLTAGAEPNDPAVKAKQSE